MPRDGLSLLNGMSITTPRACPVTLVGSGPFAPDPQRSVMPGSLGPYPWNIATLKMFASLISEK